MKKNAKSLNISKVFVLTRKILHDFQGLPLLLYLFGEILDDIHDFVFGMCIFLEENQQPTMGGRS